MANTGFYWILLAGLIFGLIHSLLASLWLKEKAVHWAGSAGKKYYRLFFVVVAGLTSLGYIALVFLFPDKVIYRIPLPWLIVTGLIELAAALAAAKSVLDSRPMAFFGLDVLLFRSLTAPDEKLNTGSFYRWMRHPIYSFSFLFIWLSPIMTWNLLALFLGVTLYTVIGSLFEENKLILAFGDAYRAYKKETPAFIPKFKR